MRFSIALPVCLVLAMTTPAYAQDWPTPAPPPPPAEAIPRPPEPSSPVWKIDTAWRGAFVTDPGLNPFSKNDYFTQFSLGASRELFEEGRFAFAPGFVWDVGSSSATARGDTTSLTVHRLSLPLEGRYGFAPWIYVFGRVAPGVMAISAKIEDPSGPATLAANQWVPTVDLSAGAAWRFAAAGRRRVGFWLTAEGGYAWAKSMSLTMTPDVPSDDPRRMGPLNLGSLTLRSPFLRIGFGVSF